MAATRLSNSRKKGPGRKHAHGPGKTVQSNGLGPYRVVGAGRGRLRIELPPDERKILSGAKGLR